MAAFETASIIDVKFWPDHFDYIDNNWVQSILGDALQRIGTTSTVTPMLPLRDMLHHTYADYLTWPEGGRDELINGVAYVKEPPAPSRCHQELVGELYHQVRLAIEGKPCRAYVAPFDVRLPESGEPDEEIRTVVQPDVLVVCDLEKLDQRGMRGGPDWLAEVLSPSTASHDQIIKLPIYERAGVREVWLIHPADRMLTIYRLDDGRYARPIIPELEGRTAIKAIPGVLIDWDRVWASIAGCP